MNKFSCYTSRAGNVLSQQLQLVWRTAMLVMAAFLFSTGLGFAQGIVFPPADTKCVSKDMEVVSATLGEDCVPCTTGSAQIENLVLSVKNTTNSTRRSFTYWALVEITAPDGIKLPLIEISDCEPGPWAGGETRSVTETDPIQFPCGSTVRLINVFLAWTDASDSERNTCGEMLANPDKINPKCGRPAEIRVTTPPATPQLTVTQPTCAAPSGTITVAVTTGLTFSVNGGAFAPYPSGGYINLTPGTYSIRARNDAGCISPASSATIVAALGNPASPSLNVTQPTCAVPTGSITLTPGAGLEYRLNTDTWGPYPSTGWTGLSAGSYTVGVRRTADITCTNSASTTILAPAGAPAAPVLSLTQPSCTVGTGAITLSPVVGMEYKLDDGVWGPYPTNGWSGLAPGPHTVYIRRISDTTCTNSSPATINDAPIVPSGITTKVDQPTCTVLTGRIEFLTPTGDFVYSIGNGYQSSPVFENVDPGKTYPLSVKSGNGCITAAGEAVINDAPIVPSGVSVEVSQPTCERLFGIITVTSPTGSNYTYSLDGGAYQASNVFSNVSPGSHSITVQSNDRCFSAPAGATVNALPVCEVFEGCTLGYWKNHTDRWVSCGGLTLTPSTKYNTIFTSANTDLTLLQALNSKGGGINNLYRQSVAALLNACHPDVNYELSYSQVISGVNAAISGGTAGSYATYLDELNNAGCPLGGTRATTSLNATSSSSLQGLGKADAGELRAYPTPFSDKATIEFATTADENYSVRLYDMRGALVKELKAGTAKAGVVNQVEVDGRNLPEGLYLARVISDSGARTVKLLLKK